jgi:hypothetical protein
VVQGKYATAIEQQARSIDLSKLLTMVRGS